jgi:5-methylcytosine-specific restriction endonuclease McrA
MGERLDKVCQLLNELEVEVETGAASVGDRDSSALELPLIIQEIVDDLQPLLSPYEVAFYWHLFRHSLAENGSSLLRVSTRGLQRGVVRSNRSETISPQHVRDTLTALETFGAIRKEGEPNRDGTPYRVLIPDEIEVCRKFRAERTPTYKCRYCNKQLTRFTATLDHVKPIAEGGDNSFENLVTACLGCNSRKQKRPVGDFVAEQ